MFGVCPESVRILSGACNESVRSGVVRCWSEVGQEMVKCLPGVSQDNSWLSRDRMPYSKLLHTEALQMSSANKSLNELSK